MQMLLGALEGPCAAWSARLAGLRQALGSLGGDVALSAAVLGHGLSGLEDERAAKQAVFSAKASCLRLPSVLARHAG